MNTIREARRLEELGAEAAREAASLAVITGLARMATCPECWSVPSRSCRVSGTHVARFVRARQLGLITEAQAARAGTSPGSVLRDAFFNPAPDPAEREAVKHDD